MSQLKSYAFCLALLLFGGRAIAFEGLIHFEMKDPKGRVTYLDYLLKGPMSRVEEDNDRLGRLAVVCRDTSGESLCLIDAKSSYAGHVRAKDGHKVPQLESDGQEREILGLPCQHFLFKRGEGPNEIWASKDLGNFHSYESGPFSRAPQPAWEEALLEAGYFPLEIKSDRISLKALSLQKKSLPDSLFEIPAGYQKLEMDRLDRP